jgi:hypothetical protein
VTALLALLLAAAPLRAASFDGLARNLSVDDRGSASERRALDEAFKAGLRSTAFKQKVLTLDDIPGAFVVSFGDTGEADSLTAASTAEARVLLSESLLDGKPESLAGALARELLGRAASAQEARAERVESYGALDSGELYARLLEAVTEAQLSDGSLCLEQGGLSRLRAELPFESAAYAALFAPAETDAPARVWAARLKDADKRLAQAKKDAKEAKRLLRRVDELERFSPSRDPRDQQALALFRPWAEERFPARVRALEGVVDELEAREKQPRKPGWARWVDSVQAAASSPLIAGQERDLARLSDRCAALQPGPWKDPLPDAWARLRRRVDKEELPYQ